MWKQQQISLIDFQMKQSKKIKWNSKSVLHNNSAYDNYL